MKLTLGQAAKEVGISKPSLSAAIKKGRVSAVKNEQGTYEIDPAELFRVYPPKSKANELGNTDKLTKTNPGKANAPGVSDEVLALLLAEKDKLIEEKEKAIHRLEQEKTDIREDLESIRKQTERLTLLLTDRSGGEKEEKRDEEIEALKETVETLKKQNRRVLYELKSQQQPLSLWERFFGVKQQTKETKGSRSANG
jgi:chromosome segregation ATPase